MCFHSDRFLFKGNFQKIRNKHAAFLSNEFSSLCAMFDHAVYLMKRLQAQFFLYSLFKICCSHVTNVVADGKIFHSGSTIPEKVILLFLKTVNQYLFTFSAIIICFV